MVPGDPDGDPRHGREGRCLPGPEMGLYGDILESDEDDAAAGHEHDGAEECGHLGQKQEPKTGGQWSDQGEGGEGRKKRTAAPLYRMKLAIGVERLRQVLQRDQEREKPAAGAPVASIAPSAAASGRKSVRMAKSWPPRPP